MQAIGRTPPRAAASRARSARTRAAAPEPLVGTTAYPSVKLPATASASALTNAWLAFLRYVPAAVLQRTAIDEIGIPSVNGAYADPWQWTGLKGSANQAIQANWFTAACRAAGKLRMRGIYFWSVDFIDDPAHPYSSLVKFEARPAAEAAIRDCAAQAAAAVG